MRLFSHSLTRGFNLFLEADKGGGSAPAGTLKEQLEAAQGKITALEGEKTSLSGQVSALEGDKTKLAGQVTTLEGEKAGLQGRVTALEGEKLKLDGEIATLKAGQKNVQQTAEERLAANNLSPAVQKKAPGVADEPEGDAAMWESYMKASRAEQSQLRAKHGAKLEAAAKAYDAQQKQ